jgi:hypothetical protein
MLATVRTGRTIDGDDVVADARRAEGKGYDTRRTRELVVTL